MQGRLLIKRRSLTESGNPPMMRRIQMERRGR